MSMGKDDPPPPPDYRGAAQEQGVANLDAARVGSRLSNPNIRTPLGSRTVSYGRGGDPDQSNFDITLSPEQQRLYQGQTRLSEGMLGLGQNTLGQVRDSLQGPLDTSGMPGQVSNVQGGQMQMGMAPGYLQYGSMPQQGGNMGAPQGGPDSAEWRNSAEAHAFDTQAQGSPIQGNVAMPDRAGVEDAMYARSTARLDPQWAQRGASVENKLTNQGLRPGTEAWDNAMKNENFAKNDAYSSARNDAILAGGAEQSRQFGMNLGQGQFANTAQGQQFGQGLAGAQFGNQAQGQQFNQGLAGGQFQNTSRQNALQEALMRRQLPLSEMNAIRTGSQPQMPQFQPYSGSQVQPAPIMQGAMAQGQADQNAYNAGQAGNSAFTSGLMQLGGAMSGAGRPWWLAPPAI